MKHLRFRVCIAAALATGLSACVTTVHFSESLDDHAEEIARLERHLIDNPGDAEALSDLGVIYVRTRNFPKGSEYLEQAYSRNQDDARTLFYLGLANEVLGRRDLALRLYGQDVSRLSPYRRLIKGRADFLRKEMARELVRTRIAEETSIGASTSPRIVAVFPLAFRGGDSRYAPLGRGLSEMVMTDLANVRTLTLVERIRLQALLDELQIAESQYVDPETAPRSGRLLGAGRIVGGSFDVEGRNLNLDVAVVTTEDAATDAIETASGDLDRLFDLEKQLVFQLLEEMEIELTPEERDAIQRVPTRNLQAFLAYSRGLEEEDAGNFEAAAGHFEQAATLDPSFELAGERAETASGAAAAGGDVDGVLASTASLEQPPGPSINLVNNRQQMLNSSISGPLAPGESAREAALEVTTSLPDPPDPPGQ